MNKAKKDESPNIAIAPGGEPWQAEVLDRCRDTAKGMGYASIADALDALAALTPAAANAGAVDDAIAMLNSLADETVKGFPLLSERLRECAAALAPAAASGYMPDGTVFTPMPTTHCGTGFVQNVAGFMRCSKCNASFGPAADCAPADPPAAGDAVEIPRGWMQDREQVTQLAEHLENIGWRPDARGDVDCVDQGAAMSAEVLRRVLLPLLAAQEASRG